ncbi:hypothetical protein [Bdellovibrio sp. NC01]|uniref:hypothetical protein n=1 Tax=Bdellovibrio sp. NC01 TaxID=2220073 RepID=UPI00115B1037|nr:hypothetical protein [Bdellovibrio sp. NC01]
MRKYVLASLVFLSGLNAFAGAREFRINRGSISPDGYAIAWGIPGQQLDFEALEATEESTEKFINENIDKVHNYVVDLETNKILLDLGNGDGEFVEFSLGGTHIGNHYHIDVKPMYIEGEGWNSDAVAIIENTKWANNLSHTLIVNRESGVKVTLDAKINDQLIAAIRAKLSKAQQEKFDKGAVNMTIEETSLDKVGNVNLVTLESYIPKSEEDGIVVKAYVKLVLKAGKIEIQALSARAK